MAEQHAWWKEAVIYQIYPRSFMDANGDGIGDLQGIKSRLPYLAKLGIDVIWLSPIYASPNDDNGYDISNYRAIMQDFGTMADFDELLAAAHALDIKIVMDLVVNHTSDEHPWFIESRKSRTNPYRDYYIWRDGKDGQAPNNWESCFSGSAWQYDAATNQYYLHLFSKKQVDLNWENPKVRDEVYDLMTFWCDKGIDGFRMDVISMISKDQRFPDGPVKPDGYGDFSPYCISGPRVHEFLQEMNARVLSHYDLLTVGEAAGVTIDEAKKYARSDGKELGMVFQFEHVEASNGRGSLAEKWTLGKPKLQHVRAILNKWQTELAGQAWNSLYWDNHDQPRAVSTFGSDAPEWRVLSAKMLATCLHLMQGTPYIYQGEELGMTNTHFHSLADCRDVEEINAWHQFVDEQKKLSPETMLACFDNMARDNARTPMQWDASPNAGFTTGTPWLAVNPNYTSINAAAEVDDPDSVFNYYRQLIALRHTHEIIVYGSFEPLLPDDPNVYAYARHHAGQTLYVACNWTPDTVPCTLFDDKQGTELISNYPQHTPGQLHPYEARALLVND
ncbi:MAG: alpha-glucosidase [Selenomonadaceae bacterium]|nr:alpha-glucosidase [Selenomonadaceae bacterium]MDY3916694.1 alpha-glucosidase [Selenomonadaceae bacterium]